MHIYHYSVFHIICLWFWFVFFSGNWTKFYSVAGIERFLAGLLSSQKISFPVTHLVIPLTLVGDKHAMGIAVTGSEIWRKYIPWSCLCSFRFCCLTVDFAYLINFPPMFSFRILFSLEFLWVSGTQFFRLPCRDCFSLQGWDMQCLCNKHV